MLSNVTTFAPEGQGADAHAVKQLETCMEAGSAAAGVLCADHHVGYSQPIGGVVAYPDYISPSGVGYDIGCGNKAVATNLLYGDIKGDLPRIMDDIQRRISFGIGQPNDEEVTDHPVFDRINRDAPIPGIRALLGTARKQLGTVGAGNHYVDLFREEGTDRVWVGVHFGSRGFGHKIASGFLALAQGRAFDERAPEGEMDSPPVLLHVEDPLGYLYIEAMTIAGEYAYAGRDVVCDKVLDILGAEGIKEVHNHHNFAWLEEQGGRKVWVIRKGATPLFPGQEGFVGGSMGENAVIIEGRSAVAGPGAAGLSFVADAARRSGEASLWSAPHGAGRVMSRTEAAGKARKRWYCRSCGWIQGAGVASPVGDGDKSQARCPSCRRVGDLNKKWVTLKKGKVDWDQVRKEQAQKNIHLRGGAADEAPEAYKRLPEVLEAHRDYVKVTHQLRPIGVVMAGANTFDPFKD